METLARLMVASTDLIEAEARALKQQAMNLLLAAGLGVVALVLVLAGLGFLLYGGFRFAAGYLTVPGAAALFGCIALVLAITVLLMARRLVRK